MSGPAETSDMATSSSSFATATAAATSISRGSRSNKNDDDNDDDDVAVAFTDDEINNSLQEPLLPLTTTTTTTTAPITALTPSIAALEVGGGQPGKYDLKESPKINNDLLLIV